MSRDDEETAEAHDSDDEDRALDLRIAEYMKVGLPVGTIACAVAAGLARGAPGVVLVLAGGALVSVIAIFWASIRTLVGETPLSGSDAYALGAPRAEEEQKRAVLRALKDLEFERSVGKISEEDYQALVSKYRAEAKRLLRTLEEDAGPERARALSLVARRLAAEGLADAPHAGDREAPKAAKEPAPKKARRGKPAQAEPAPEVRHEAEARAEAAPAKGGKVACAACGTANDVDAVFCKKCGARQRPDDDEDADVDQEGRKEASS
jgi:hypothetical protein